MTKHVAIFINTGNEAFAEAPGVEVSRILEDLANRLVQAGVELNDIAGLKLRDINGNHVGEVKVVEIE